MTAYNLGVIKAETGDADGAYRHYTQVIEDPGSPPATKTSALLNRGNLKSDRRDFQGAIDDYSAILQTPNTLPSTIAKALSNRAGVYLIHQHLPHTAILDYNRLLEMTNVPEEIAVRAHYLRATARQMIGESDGAIEDLNVILKNKRIPQTMRREVEQKLTEIRDNPSGKPKTST